MESDEMVDTGARTLVCDAEWFWNTVRSSDEFTRAVVGSLVGLTHTIYVSFVEQAFLGRDVVVFSLTIVGADDVWQHPRLLDVDPAIPVPAGIMEELGPGWKRHWACHVAWENLLKRLLGIESWSEDPETDRVVYFG